MSTRHRRMGLVFGFGLGAALLASAVFTSDPAEAQTGVGFCSASSDLSPTGRQSAMVVATAREPWVCLRYHLGGAVDPSTPDCWVVGRAIGCTEVHDVSE
jgi:hypothetical protein